MSHDFDVLVLGAGPGGYVAAIRAAQLGLRTAIVEKEYWGGVCLNVGCIPTKSLLRNAELVSLLRNEAADFGISGEFSYDYAKAHSRSRAVSERMTKGIHFLMKKNKITQLHGWGTFVDANTVQVDNNGAVTTHTFASAIIAAGATTKMLPGTSVSQNVVTYKEQILADQVPGSIIIGGSGAIGTEFAYVLRSYGADVTIVEYLDRIVPTEDPEISAELAKAYKKLGIKLMTATKVEEIVDTGAGVRVTISPASGGEQQLLEADRFLSAVGFAPRVEGYGLERLGVALSERGAIAIDEHMRTNVGHIYAIGDCTGKLMLAHTAEAQGIVAAETIAGVETREINYDMIPRATYSQPQIASFGYTEQQAKDHGFDPVVAKFPFAANGKAWGLGHATGFVKIVADRRYNEILGAHMIGPDVTELLPELTLAQAFDLTAEEVGANIHAHPTLSEAMLEAAHGIAGHMINY
ncbi:MAG: dihydrolipoyl dehydrogenase [Arachnia propionica]|nr:MAG: dihydrolipoyl dehydrogenase [Arachnia propionica]